MFGDLDCTSKRVARVCQHQLSFLLIPGIGNFLNYRVGPIFNLLLYVNDTQA